LPSRFVEKWKRTDDGGTKAKRRLVILGFKDPHVLQLERSAPTPTHEAFTTTLQGFASLKRAATSSDIRNAFGQSRKTTRQQRIAASLPPGLCDAGFDVDPRQLLMAETEVYGLISGPSWLRQTLVSDFESWGYQRNPYDKCIMTLKSSRAGEVVNAGTVLIEVDDILEGGNEEHHKKMELFYAKYQCGKSKRLIDLGDEGTLISGIRVKQRRDVSFTWDMIEYADKMELIEVPRGYITQTEQIGPEMLTRVKGSNGQIGWLGGNGRPDLAAGHSIIAGGYKDESPLLIGQCNQCVKQAQAHKIAIRVWSIPIQDLRLVTFCDSSFDFKGERHQQGWLTGYTNRSLNANEKAPVSLALWRSRKLPRKAGSPQLVETYAASYACADTCWVRCLLCSMLYSDYDISLQRPRHFGPRSIEPTVSRTDRGSVKDPEVSLLSERSIRCFEQ